MALSALFIDFDSYFASVEQQDDAALRGRPVAVAPVLAETTCCIAASYQAKAFGIKTGTQVAQARRLCPGLVVREARHERYVRLHHQLVQAVHSRIPVDAVASIDEMACSLTGTWQTPQRALAVAREVKAAVRAVAGNMTCSIGIAPNRFLAKIASKMNKPDGATLLADADLPQALYALELDDITGIGRRMQARLQAAGIASVRQLYAADAATLRHAWGSIEGERMYARLRGEPVPEPVTVRASVGHSHVLPPDCRGAGTALAILHRLLQKAAWRLRSVGFLTGGLSVTLRYVDGRCWQGKRRLACTADSLALSRVLRQLWMQRPARTPPLLGVGVTLTHLVEARSQALDLFAEARGRGRLNNAMDRLNHRFGKNAVYLGGAHRALDAAPMRIAFTRIPDPETER